MLSGLRKINTREKGGHYEKLAESFLKNKGLKSLRCNYYCPSGEIDLIMSDRGDVVFVEVRFRNNSSYGHAIETITSSKRKKIIRAARFFLAENKKFQNSNCRFDVVGIDKDEKGNIHIDWIKHAFME